MTEFPEWAQYFGYWVAAGLTIAIYSFLYKDNPFYKLAEHIFIGASTGYLIVIAWQNAIKSLLLDPVLYPIGWTSYLVIIPGIMGFLMFARFSKNIAWTSRVSLAFIIGYGSGLTAPNIIQAYLIRHTGSTIMPLFQPGIFSWNPFSIITAIAAIGFLGALIYLVQSDKYADLGVWPRVILIAGAAISFLSFFLSATYSPDSEQWLISFEASFFQFIILAGVISVLFYFFYSIEHKKTLKGVAKTGIIYLMIFFGASFGYTVMGRVSLAIGRMRFMVESWGTGVKEHPSQLVIALPVIAGISMILLLSHKYGKKGA